MAERTLNEDQIKRYVALLKEPTGDLVGHLNVLHTAVEKIYEILMNTEEPLNSEEWADDEIDEALSRHLFWWKWGN